MSDAPALDAAVPVRRRAGFGIAGIVAAFLALGLAVVPAWALQVREPPPPTLTEAIADAGAKLIDKLRHKGAPTVAAAPLGPNWHAICATAAAALGVLGVLLGAVSWIRREDHRVSVVAASVGVVAVAWHFLIAAVSVAVLVVIVAALAGAIDGW